MLEIRTADEPKLTRGGVIFFFTIIWGIYSALMYYFVEEKIIAIVLISLGLPVWMYLLNRQGRLEGFLRRQRSNYIQSKNGFCCQKCSTEIAEPIKNQNVHGEPILYNCIKCNILWFVGSVNSDYT